MTDQPEKLDLSSQDIAEEKRQELLQLFPEVRTEGEKIDFERLRLALGEATAITNQRKVEADCPDRLRHASGAASASHTSGTFVRMPKGSCTAP